MMRQPGLTGVVAVAAVAVWAGTALGQPFRGGLPRCEVQLNMCNANLAACQAAAQTFPATGQTTCWNSAGTPITCAGTGQDGDVQAGATLSFTDNGDGTITDNNTKLVWEKKSDDGTIHDFTILYTWDNAFAVHIAGLNSANFAGHSDWRLPNLKELQSIVNYEKFNPALSTEFNSSCELGSTVLTGSCTEPSFYWSSTTNASLPAFAWAVSAFNGFVNLFYKSDINLRSFVRAVRGPK